MGVPNKVVNECSSLQCAFNLRRIALQSLEFRTGCDYAGFSFLSFFFFLYWFMHSGLWRPNDGRACEGVCKKGLVRGRRHAATGGGVAWFCCSGEKHDMGMSERERGSE